MVYCINVWEREIGDIVECSTNAMYIYMHMYVHVENLCLFSQ